MIDMHWITIAVFFVDFIAIFPVGLHIAGFGDDGREVWLLFILGGIAHTILGAFAIAGGDIFLGFAVWVFAWIFAGIGLINLKGYDAVGAGHFFLATALVIGTYTVYLAQFYVDWTIIFATIVVILLIFAGMDYGVIPPKAAGWAGVIFALECLLIAALMWWGYILY